MATTKHMLVLANSIKHWPGTCIAGREIVSSGSTYSFGPWIRPVSSHGEGELSPSESCLSNGKQPKVMDFVEVPFAGQMKDALQPENWLIDDSQRWKSVNALYEKPSIDQLVDSPKNVWLEPSGRFDRIAAQFLKGKRLKRSLLPIHVPSIRVRFERSNTFVVEPPNGCYLCVSLAPEWNGYHYKVVATIVE